MNDSSDVSDLGTPSSIIYDDIPPGPQRQAVIQSRGRSPDTSDVSDLGTPSSMMYDDQSHQSHQSHQSPVQQRTQDSDQSSIYHTPPQERPIQQVPDQASPQVPEYRAAYSGAERLPIVQTPKRWALPGQRTTPQQTTPKTSQRTSEQIRDLIDLDRFVVDYTELERLQRKRDYHAMENYVTTNYFKICAYNFVASKLIQLIKEYRSGKGIVPSITMPGNIVSELRRILEESKKKWALFDIPVHELGLLRGSALEAKLKSSNQRISEVLDAAYERANRAEESYQGQAIYSLSLIEKVEELNAELLKAYDYIARLKGEHLYEEPPTKEEFVRDLNIELNMQGNLNSSLREEIRTLREKNRKLLENVEEVEIQQANDHQRRMQELAEAAKDLELNEGIRKAVVEKIKSLTANTDEVNKAVNEWMRSINEVIDSKKQQIKDLSIEVKKWDDKVARRQVHLSDLKEAVTSLESSIESLEEGLLEKEAQFNQIEIAYRSMSDTVSSLAKEYKGMAGADDETSDLFYSFASSDSARSPRSPIRRKPRRLSIRSPLMSPTLGPLYEASDESAEVLRRGSPDYSPRRQQESSPSSLESTPSGRILFPDATPPPDLSIPDLGSFQGRVAPGTQTLSRAPSRFAPEIEPYHSPQFMGGVVNRIDVGDSFNMRTVHTGESTPYSQVTRVDSSIPEAGPSRMVDSPLNVMQRAEFSPSDYVTPYISKMSRFGITDPTAKVFNAPPGPSFAAATGFKKTVLLTSPKREEPLLVNIDVNPKPLTESPSGEHFICDISLNLQPTGKQHRVSPVYTFGTPPAVTPSSARRYGLFTPQGIFQKRHYNIRRVHWPDEYQSPDLPWSPHDLADARSPISGLVPSPYVSDSSISWEKGPDSSYNIMDRTYDASPPTAMNRTYDASPPTAMNKTFVRSPSPVIKGSYYGIQSPDSTVDSSPSYRRQSPGFDRTFDRSQSPVIQGPSYRGQSPGVDRTFDRSPSPVDQGPAYVSRSPRQDRTFDVSPSYRGQSPGLDRTFDRSPSPVDQAYVSRSPRQDRTFDRSPSPVIQGPAYRSRSPRQDRTFDRSPSPDFDRTRDSPMSLTRTFDSHGQTPRRTFDSHRLQESAFESHRQSPLNRTFDRSSSPVYDQPYDSSGSFHQSTASRLDGTFNRSPYSSQSGSRTSSPIANRTYNRSTSPQMNRTFSRTPSPQYQSNITFEEDSPLDTGFYEHRD